jgi:hypothetical protein
MSFEIKCRDINPDPPLTNTFSIKKVTKILKQK